MKKRLTDKAKQIFRAIKVSSQKRIKKNYVNRGDWDISFDEYLVLHFELN